MLKDFFKEHYGQLPLSTDAYRHLGILPGMATLGDIHKAFEGRPDYASAHPDLTAPSGFFVTDMQCKFFSIP